MQSSTIKLGLTVLAAAVIAPLAMAATSSQWIKTGGMNEYIKAGSNLRNQPGFTRAADMPTIKSISKAQGENMVFTGRVVKGPVASGRTTNWYEMRIKGQNRRLYVAQSRVGGGSQERIRAMHDTSWLRARRGKGPWQCAMPQNMDLPENAAVRAAFSAPAFNANRVYKSRNAKILPDNATNHSVEIKIDAVNGRYHYRRRGDNKFASVAAVFCSDGRKQVVKFQGDNGRWYHLTLGEIGGVQPVVVKAPQTGSALPNPTGLQVRKQPVVVVPARESKAVEIRAGGDNSELPTPSNF